MDYRLKFLTRKTKYGLIFSLYFSVCLHSQLTAKIFLMFLLFSNVYSCKVLLNISKHIIRSLLRNVVWFIRIINSIFSPFVISWNLRNFWSDKHSLVFQWVSVGCCQDNKSYKKHGNCQLHNLNIDIIKVCSIINC